MNRLEEIQGPSRETQEGRKVAIKKEDTLWFEKHEPPSNEVHSDSS